MQKLVIDKKSNTVSLLTLINGNWQIVEAYQYTSFYIYRDGITVYFKDDHEISYPTNLMITEIL